MLFRSFSDIDARHRDFGFGHFPLRSMDVDHSTQSLGCGVDLFVHNRYVDSLDCHCYLETSIHRKGIDFEKPRTEDGWNLYLGEASKLYGHVHLWFGLWYGLAKSDFPPPRHGRRLGFYSFANPFRRGSIDVAFWRILQKISIPHLAIVPGLVLIVHGWDFWSNDFFSQTILAPNTIL